MLQRLHVKNLALMEETEVEFGPGLNILTGETGAGKSLLIGSVNLALGAKFERDMLREGAQSALVELVFTCGEGLAARKMEEMELEPEDGAVIISRRMQPGKSVFKINGETVTARQVKELAEVLLDIHGQHEHQSLLHKKKHMEILDAYCGEAVREPAGEVSDAWEECQKLERALAEESMDETAREREQSLAEFECREIEEARLIPGEDEELEQRYRRMSNSRKISESLAESYRHSGTDGDGGAGAALSRALRALGAVTAYDAKLEDLESRLAEVDDLLADYNRDLAEYMRDCEFDGEEFARTEERLNLINHLKEKYGDTIPAILQYAEERQAYLDKLSDYDAYLAELTDRMQTARKRLEDACGRLSEVRREYAAVLTGLLTQALNRLNFPSVKFETAVRPGGQITAKGYDDVEFLISTNPGEGVKPLSRVASGGELSRVMLAIKTVLAGQDEIDTLIFDEIDAGISGRTAWKVAGRLSEVSAAHQVLCITHLPQIAAMADTHFVIEKSSDDGRTVTDIRQVDGEEELAELARLLGSDTLTSAALSNAGELREQALQQKSAKEPE
ncbi:MAG: DNA repair protein RecN [Clostridium sp.]|nr:DNA repair protein RecN [Acetatifactor muris]MCM1527011.1 DNA repair protein RecN [Bacteroides sp.]MCM1561987.1 DNA repair protein RecN [Clostridium sp.]